MWRRHFLYRRRLGHKMTNLKPSTGGTTEVSFQKMWRIRKENATSSSTSFLPFGLVDEEVAGVFYFILHLFCPLIKKKERQVLDGGVLVVFSFPTLAFPFIIRVGKEKTTKENPHHGLSLSSGKPRRLLRGERRHNPFLWIVNQTLATNQRLVSLASQETTRVSWVLQGPTPRFFLPSFLIFLFHMSSCTHTVNNK